MDNKIDTRKFREKYMLTRVQFAELVGVSPHTVAAWEINRYTPSGPVLKFIEYFEKLHRKNKDEEK